MKKILLLTCLIIINATFFNTYAQFSIDQIGLRDSITFDSFAGTGFVPSPATGQLDSDNWRVTGLSDGDMVFGGSYTTGDYARGSSTGMVGTGGMYAFDNGASGPTLGVQPIGTDFTPGAITLKLQNNTGLIIEDLEVAFDVWFMNDQDRSNSFNFYYSHDDTTYIHDTTVNTHSIELADTMGWESFSKVSSIENVNIPVGDIFYIQWRGDDLNGTGSRDEFGLDNIIILSENASVPLTAEVQFIHNSSDVNLDSLHIFIDGQLEVGNMEYRTSTKYKLIDANKNIRVSIAPPNSVDTSNAYWSGTWHLNGGDEYVAIINGLEGLGYAPPASTRPLNIYLHDSRRVSNNVDNTDVLFFHGSTDIGPIDVAETSIPYGVVMDNVEYADFVGYEEYLTDDYVVEIRDSTSTTTYYSFALDYLSRNLKDSAITVVSSGFQNPTLNNNGAAFDILYAPAQGGNLISLMSAPVGLTESGKENNFSIYPNPAKDFLNISLEEKAAFEIEIYNTLGELVIQENMNGNKKQLNISHLAEGSYILKLISDEGVKSSVFVK